MSMDATHKMIRSMPARGWFREKRPVFVMNGPRKEKIVVTVIGAIGPDAAHHFGFYDAGNWDNVKDFLARVHKKFGKVLMFMDNATYHRKDELAKITKKTNGDMQFEFFLTYTPELNPAEIQWREMKQRIAGTDIQTAEELISFVKSGISRKVIPIVAPPGYLIP
ncbi:MAG: transposase [Desulfovibrionales bacterium]|nr:transposase [Desulfovibrionales bacterium]